MSDKKNNKSGSKDAAKDTKEPVEGAKAAEAPVETKETEKAPEPEVLEGSPNFEATYKVDDKDVGLGDIVATAAEGLEVEAWNALTQKAKDEKIQAVLDELIPKEEEAEEEEEINEEDKNEAQKLGLPKDVVYTKSFPAGTFPGDNVAAQRALAAEAGSHCLSNGVWKTGSKKNKDGSIMHYILPGEGS